MDTFDGYLKHTPQGDISRLDLYYRYANDIFGISNYAGGAIRTFNQVDINSDI